MEKLLFHFEGSNLNNQCIVVVEHGTQTMQNEKGIVWTDESNQMACMIGKAYHVIIYSGNPNSGSVTTIRVDPEMILRIAKEITAIIETTTSEKWEVI